MTENTDNSTRSMPAAGELGSSNLRYALSQLPPSVDRPPPPERLGTVRLQEMIGRGGMGRVFRGWDEALHREVAVKFLECPEGVLDDAAIARFMDGARAAANVKHMNLTTILQADQVGGVPYLVLEFVRGETLHSVVARRGPLSPAQVLAIMEEVCGAVAALHEANILHLDIKPSNILLDVNGRTYLTDFGLTLPRAVAHGDGGHATAGTPPYMAPEMFDGLLSPRTDVYALGITAFQLLTGRPPFRGEWPRIAMQHKSSPIPTEELREKGVPAELIEEIERATHKQQSFRHKGSRQLQEKLHELRKASNKVSPSPLDLTELLGLTSESQGSSHSPLESRTPVYERLRELVTARKSQHELRPVSLRDHSILSVTRPVIDPNTTITMSLLCTVCHYDLQGLSRDGKCPECGTEKAWALRPDRLIFADLDWLIAMRRSLLQLLIAFIVILFGVSMQPAMRNIIGKGNATYQYAEFAMAIIALGLFLVGYIRVLRKEMGRTQETRESGTFAVSECSRLSSKYRSLARVFFWAILLTTTCVPVFLKVERFHRNKYKLALDARYDYTDGLRAALNGSNEKLMEYLGSKRQEEEFRESRLEAARASWNKASRISSNSLLSVGITMLFGIAALSGYMCTLIRRGDRRGDLCRARGYFAVHWCVTLLVCASIVLYWMGPSEPTGVFYWLISYLARGGPIAICVAFAGTLFASVRAISTAIQSSARTLQPNLEANAGM